MQAEIPRAQPSTGAPSRFETAPRRVWRLRQVDKAPGCRAPRRARRPCCAVAAVIALGFCLQPVGELVALPLVVSNIILTALSA